VKIVDHITISFSLFQTFLVREDAIFDYALRHKVSMKNKRTNKSNEAEQNADLFSFVSAEKLI